MMGSVFGPSRAFAEERTAGAFKLVVRDRGVHRVRFDDLNVAGVSTEPVPSGKVAVTHLGEPVPVWLHDGGDGTFGPGDSLEFLGNPPAGEEAFHHQYTVENVYRLTLSGADGARMQAREFRAPKQGEAYRALRVVDHQEHQMILPRFSRTIGSEDEDLWYWAKLNHMQLEKLEFQRDFSSQAVGDAASPVRFDLSVRGWSRPAHKANESVRDHAVEFLVNGEVVATERWDGRDEHGFSVELPAGTVPAALNKLEVRVPERNEGKDGETIIDVILVNWVRIRYARSPVVRAPLSFFEVGPESEGDVAAKGTDTGIDKGTVTKPVRIETSNGQMVVAYAESGDGSVYRVEGSAADGLLVADLPGSVQRCRVVMSGMYRSVSAVVPDWPSSLSDASNQADYIMISHASLIDAVTPLAEFHRERGLAVSVVDVEDVFDEFSHGLTDPRGIRRFLKYARENWQAPSTRFVLLVGDASNDLEHRGSTRGRHADHTQPMGDNQDFGWVPAAEYSEEDNTVFRNLVTTYAFQAGYGHSASDTYFAQLEGDDFQPDLAIGRFAVATAEEVDAIVSKTIAYAKNPPPGLWRRRLLWITNEEKYFQASTERIAGLDATAPYEARRVFPKPEEADNKHHQSRLREAFDEGTMLVHFWGHGGRYIWRTGPPDFKKNHDLFTLHDLDRLKPTDRLPVVLSMTCFSAPFDHPSADSIGEKLHRLENRGAVAVVAASWRNTGSERFSSRLVQEMLRNDTIGEAVQHAKEGIPRVLVEQYNLLGDPAIPIARPSGAVTLSWGDGTWDVDGEVLVPGFEGQALVEWMDSNGDVADERVVDVKDSKFTASPGFVGEMLVRIEGVRVYAWNEEDDAAGALAHGEGGARTSTVTPRAVSVRPATSGDRDGRPDVILVTLDTTRRDFLPSYRSVGVSDRQWRGAMRLAKAPALQDLISGGELYTNAWSVSSWTLPAHASLFTGMYPSVHGAHNQRGGETSLKETLGLEWLAPLRVNRLDEEAVTVAELLSEKGYRTGAFVGGPWLDPAFGLMQGFDVVDAEPMTIFGRAGEDLADAAIDFLRETDADQPVHLFLNLFDAHWPWNPPDEYLPEALQGKPELGSRPGKKGSHMPEEGRETEAISRYAAEIARADRQLGRVLDELAAQRRLRGALVIVTADHGEMLGEDEEWGHSRYLNPALTRVPLIVRRPLARNARSRRKELVSILDVPAIIAEETGIALPEAASSRKPGQRTRLLREWFRDDYWINQGGEEFDRDLRAVIEGPWELTVSTTGERTLRAVSDTTRPIGLTRGAPAGEEATEDLDESERKQIMDRLGAALEEELETIQPLKPVTPLKPLKPGADDTAGQEGDTDRASDDPPVTTRGGGPSSEVLDALKALGYSE